MTHDTDRWDIPSRIAWAAGLFEGEGNIAVRHNKHQKNVTLLMQVNSTDEDTLVRFHDIVFTGNLRGPYKLSNRPQNKPYWSWMSMAVPGIISVWDAFRPFMSQRRLEQGDSSLHARYKYEQSTDHFNILKHKFPDYIIDRNGA